MKHYALHLRQRERSRCVRSSCERACRCVSDCPRAGRCVRHAQCVARTPHAYTWRTDRDLCHWLRSVHRRVYRRPTVLHVQIRENARRSTPSLDRSFDDRESDRRSFTPADRYCLFDRQRHLFAIQWKITRKSIFCIEYYSYDIKTLFIN